jgi:hypothetical protein
VSDVSRFVEFWGRYVFGGERSELTKDVLLFAVLPLVVIGLFTQILWIGLLVVALTFGCFFHDFRQFNREHRDG